jgi:hypothetical protein
MLESWLRRLLSHAGNARAKSGSDKSGLGFGFISCRLDIFQASPFILVPLSYNIEPQQLDRRPSIRVDQQGTIGFNLNIDRAIL